MRSLAMSAQIDRITTLYPVDEPRYNKIATVIRDLAPDDSLYCFSPATLKQRIQVMPVSRRRLLLEVNVRRAVLAGGFIDGHP